MFAICLANHTWTTIKNLATINSRWFGISRFRFRIRNRTKLISRLLSTKSLCYFVYKTNFSFIQNLKILLQSHDLKSKQKQDSSFICILLTSDSTLFILSVWEQKTKFLLIYYYYYYFVMKKENYCKKLID